MNILDNFALKGHHKLEQGNALYNNTIQLFALKGLHIKEQGNALLYKCNM